MRGHEHGLAGLEVGDDRALPVRQQAVDHELERLGAGHLAVDRGVARVVHLAELAVVGEGRRRHVEGAAPQLELLGTELLERLRLVLALQRAVVALVEAPGAGDRDPQPVGGVERDVRGLDRPAEQRGVQHVGEDPGLGEQLAAAPGLVLALLGQADVHPSGEQVQFVPLALAVAEQDESAGHALSLRRAGRRSEAGRRRMTAVPRRPERAGWIHGVLSARPAHPRHHRHQPAAPQRPLDRRLPRVPERRGSAGRRSRLRRQRGDRVRARGPARARPRRCRGARARDSIRTASPPRRRSSPSCAPVPGTSPPI